MVIQEDSAGTGSEAFRTLRTNLMFNNTERALTTILVTAPAEAGDKSTVVANLAVTFAQAGNKTILVDSDLRKPAQHELWGANNARGLTTMMTEDAALSNPPLQATDIPDLQLLTTGPLPPVPADVLSNQRMSEVIGVLKARASYVLFDSPPVLAATDAALLGAKVDGTLLVVRAGHTRRDQLAQARQALERVHVRLLGAILTDAPKERGTYYG